MWGYGQDPGSNVVESTVDGYEALDSDAGPLQSLRSPIRIDGVDIGSVQIVGSATPISEATAESLAGLAFLAGISMLLGGSALALAIVRGLRPLATEFNRMLGRLEDSARARTEFLATVPHELRTPVTIARGHLETLERSGALDPERVLGTARVVRLSLVETLRPPERTIRADPARLQQALLNLAVNATVHSPPGTRVIVSAAVTGERVVFAVADEGPGIPDGVVERVLEPFVRAETDVGPHGRHDSSGLGLAVVDVVARAHGGHVTIDTGSEGTVVSLDLPARGPG